MKRVLTGAFAICASTAILSAQSQTPAQSPSQRPDAAANRITLQGCIQKNAGAPSATPGATGTAGSAGAYVLQNAAKISAPPSTPAPATQPRSDTGAANMAATSYRLDADESKLTPHVGHKVEVTGTVEEQASSSPAGGAGASASMSGGPKLKVDTVKMIASSCSGGN